MEEEVEYSLRMQVAKLQLALHKVNNERESYILENHHLKARMKELQPSSPISYSCCRRPLSSDSCSFKVDLDAVAKPSRGCYHQSEDRILRSSFIGSTRSNSRPGSPTIAACSGHSPRLHPASSTHLNLGSNPLHFTKDQILQLEHEISRLQERMERTKVKLASRGVDNCCSNPGISSERIVLDDGGSTGSDALLLEENISLRQQNCVLQQQCQMLETQLQSQYEREVAQRQRNRTAAVNSKKAQDVLERPSGLKPPCDLSLNSIPANFGRKQKGRQQRSKSPINIKRNTKSATAQRRACTLMYAGLPSGYSVDEDGMP